LSHMVVRLVCPRLVGGMDPAEIASLRAALDAATPERGHPERGHPGRGRW